MRRLKWNWCHQINWFGRLGVFSCVSALSRVASIASVRRHRRSFIGCGMFSVGTFSLRAEKLDNIDDGGEMSCH